MISQIILPAGFNLCCFQELEEDFVKCRLWYFFLLKAHLFMYFLNSSLLRVLFDVSFAQSAHENLK